MSTDDQTKWDTRYEAGEYEGRPYPSPFLEQWLPPAAPGACALDIACGLGRNTRYLAQCGYQALGIDISAVALSRAAALAGDLSARWEQLDLDDSPLPDGPYEVIVVSRFLDRRLIPQIRRQLKSGGRLVYEQHVIVDVPVGGPKSPRFRLGENELLRLFADLHIVHYNEGVVTDPDGAKMGLAQLIADCR